MTYEPAAPAAVLKLNALILTDNLYPVQISEFMEIKHF